MKLSPYLFVKTFYSVTASSAFALYNFGRLQMLQEERCKPYEPSGSFGVDFLFSMLVALRLCVCPMGAPSVRPYFIPQEKYSIVPENKTL